MTKVVVMKNVSPHVPQGHAQTVEKVLKWVDEEGGVEGVTVCDAGCGTGKGIIDQTLSEVLVKLPNECFDSLIHI